MSVLITGGDGRLAHAFAGSLAQHTAVRLVDSGFSGDAPQRVGRQNGDLRDREFVRSALEGIDVVVHLAPLAPVGANDQEAIDRATRGSYVLATAALEAGIRRFVLGSSLDLFDRLPADWKVTEAWRPRPEPRSAHLVPWLAELSWRECLRSAPVSGLCLRFGCIVASQEIATKPYNPGWLHLDDAVSGLHRALDYFAAPRPQRSWRIFHITAGGPLPKVRLSAACGQDFGYEPAHDFAAHHPAHTPTDGSPQTIAPRELLHPLDPPQPTCSRAIRNVVIFGAGGPVAAALAQELRSSYTLRLTDLLPIAQVAAGGNRQSPGAPLPTPLEAPHECRVVDVRDPGAVMTACEGMDAIVNCTVVRHDPIEAFLVNTVGAYNVMQAAVAHGIRRVVHTGPEQVDTSDPACYRHDYDVPGDAPPRPGAGLYFHSKFLGQEICRTFADYYDLEVPVLLYGLFVNPELDTGTYPFSISWQDSARSLRRALEVRSLPSPYEVINIVSDIPYGRFSNGRAKLLLDWEPRDAMPGLWTGGASG